MSGRQALLLVCGLLCALAPLGSAQNDTNATTAGADADEAPLETTAVATPAPGPCDYLEAGPGLGPLQRDVEAALRGEADELVVGALGIKGSARLYTQWNETFATYMTEAIGPQLGNKTFRMVYLDFDTAYRAVEDNCFDFVFANPSMHLCLELGWKATPVVTLLNYRGGYDLDRFMGTIFARANDTDIEELADIQGKILEGVSVTGLGAFQMQWHEFWANGIDVFREPAQVRFAYNQQEIVKDVIAGNADVGLVRTDMAEGMAARGVINLTDIKVINIKPDDDFPFPYSTSMVAPEWPLAALPHIGTGARKIIADAMTSLDSESPAAKTGLYAGWVPPVSYMGLFTMMGDLGYLRNNRCTGNSDTYDTIFCPAGEVKISREEFDEGTCNALAEEDPRYTCPEGRYICVCSPCRPAPPPAPLIVLPGPGEVSNGAPVLAIAIGCAAAGVVALAGILYFLKYGSGNRRGSKSDASDPESGDDKLESSVDLSTDINGNNISSMVQSMAKESKGINMKASSTTDQDAPVVLELLATSGNSRVYKAMWRGVIVAQKRIELPTNPSTFQKKQSSMAMEAAISASMSHPNVVQTYNCEIVPIKRSHLSKEQHSAPTRSSTSPNLGLVAGGRDADDELCQSTTDVVMWEMHIIQELCNRGSVTACLGEGTLPGQDGNRTPPNLMVALHIAKDVACGMLHIHSMQIVHGDLKSGNVLLVDTKRDGADMIAKVADFGLAVKMDESQTHISGVQSGTLTHMSPELLLQGLNSKPGDVYAYGIFMYELFCGQRPWKGAKPAQIINSVVQHQKRPVFPPTVPRQVVELATRCWAQDPSHRPSFNEILRDVGDLIKLADEGVMKVRSAPSRNLSTVSAASSHHGDTSEGQSNENADLSQRGEATNLRSALRSQDSFKKNSSITFSPKLEAAAAAAAAEEEEEEEEEESEEEEDENDGTVMFMMKGGGLTSTAE